MADLSKISGMDKAAILFKTLGTSLAVQLFKGLNEQEIIKIRRRMNSIEPVPFKVKKAVLEDFYFSFISEKFKPASEETKKPFEFLQKLTDEQIIYLISTEDPRIMALTIAQLDVDRQVNVLQHLDPTVQPGVFTEMGLLNDIPLEGVVNIANNLKEKSAFLPRASEFSRGGGENLAGILSKMLPRDEKRFMEHLEKEAPELIKELKRYHFSFEDTVKLPSETLGDILKAVEPSEIAYALKGQSKELQEYFMNSLPERTKIILEDEINLIEGPQPRRKVEASQKKILDKARQLEKEGRFKLEDFMEADLIE